MKLDEHDDTWIQEAFRCVLPHWTVVVTGYGEHMCITLQQDEIKKHLHIHNRTGEWICDAYAKDRITDLPLNTQEDLNNVASTLFMLKALEGV